MRGADAATMAALTARSIVVRDHRRETKDMLRTLPPARARRVCAELLLLAPAHVRGMRVGDLVAACRWMGPVRARQVLGACRVDERTRIADLAVERRRAIAIELVGGRG